VRHLCEAMMRQEESSAGPSAAEEDHPVGGVAPGLVDEMLGEAYAMAAAAAA